MAVSRHDPPESTARYLAPGCAETGLVSVGCGAPERRPWAFALVGRAFPITIVVPLSVGRSRGGNDLPLDIEKVVMNLVGGPAGEHENCPLVASAADAGAAPLTLVEAREQCL